MESSTREQIVAAADRLFYEQGYAQTSFGDLAQAVGISRGNFYHHFKTKDEVLDAVLAARMQGKQALLSGWERQAGNPEARLRRFIDMLIANRAPIMRHGCPVGSLCSELARLDHAAQPRANAVLDLFRIWLQRQFAALGRADADALALHLLARSQGISVLANAYRSESFLRNEVRELHAWLDGLCAQASTKETTDVHRAAEVLGQPQASRRASRSAQALVARRPR